VVGDSLDELFDELFEPVDLGMQLPSITVIQLLHLGTRDYLKSEDYMTS